MYKFRDLQENFKETKIKIRIKEKIKKERKEDEVQV
jgi:hypothetical protein